MFKSLLEQMDQHSGERNPWNLNSYTLEYSLITWNGDYKESRSDKCCMEKRTHERKEVTIHRELYNLSSKPEHF